MLVAVAVPVPAPSMVTPGSGLRVGMLEIGSRAAGWSPVNIRYQVLRLRSPVIGVSRCQCQVTSILSMASKWKPNWSL